MRLHALVDANGLLGGIAYHPTVGALGNVLFQLGPDLRIDVLIQVIAEFL
jgi:hypothetical protein